MLPALNIESLSQNRNRTATYELFNMPMRRSLHCLQMRLSRIGPSLNSPSAAGKGCSSLLGTWSQYKQRSIDFHTLHKLDHIRSYEEVSVHLFSRHYR